MSEMEPMDDFERSLSRALKRVDVRAETARKFLEIAAAAELHRKQTDRGWFRPSTGGRVYVMSRPALRGWMGSAIACMLAVGVFAGERMHQRHEQVRAEQQFETAMRVTDHALDQTRAQLERAGLKLGD